MTDKQKNTLIVLILLVKKRMPQSRTPLRYADSLRLDLMKPPLENVIFIRSNVAYRVIYSNTFCKGEITSVEKTMLPGVT